MNTTKTTQTFPVLDMSCAACATRVEKTLNRQPCVYHAQVDLAAATAASVATDGLPSAAGSGAGFSAGV